MESQTKKQNKANLTSRECKGPCPGPLPSLFCYVLSTGKATDSGLPNPKQELSAALGKWPHLGTHWGET